MEINRDNSLRSRREKIVQQHIDAENSGNLDEMIASFHQPRYEVFPMGAVFEGEQPVRDLIAGLILGFPDFHFAPSTIHYADHAVIVEARATGTHQAEWGGIPPKHKKMDIALVCIFDFDEDRLINEKVFFDFASLQRQLS